MKPERDLPGRRKPAIAGARRHFRASWALNSDDFSSPIVHEEVPVQMTGPNRAGLELRIL